MLPQKGVLHSPSSQLQQAGFDPACFKKGDHQSQFESSQGRVIYIAQQQRSWRMMGWSRSDSMYVCWSNKDGHDGVDDQDQTHSNNGGCGGLILLLPPIQ